MGSQKFIQKYMQKLKNMKKDQWLIIILAGVLLFVIVLPAGDAKKEKKTEKTEAGKQQTAEEAEAGREGEKMEAYETYLEERLEELLGKMEGVGKVKVMVTLEDNGEQILEKDERESRTTTEEGSGETARKASEVELEYAAIFVEEDGNRTPYIIQVKKPKVKGVVVICEGGANSSIAQNISKAIGALFAIETHKIMVMKME